MKTLSIITPVLPSMSRFMWATMDSVMRAKEAASAIGWKVDWIVVIDGEGDVPTITGADIQLRLARRCGTSAARNFAMARSGSDWIVPLDADDEIESTGLCEILQRVGGDEEVDWIGVNRLLMDGAETPHWKEDAARWEPGELAEQWAVPFCFHPNTIVVRRLAALQVNGWPAVPVNEDLFFVFNLSERFAGRFIPLVMTRYRVWEGQTIADSSYMYLKRNSFDFIAASLNARRQRLGKKLVVQPVSGAAYGNMHK